jgi:hypothetical protein
MFKPRTPFIWAALLFFLTSLLFLGWVFRAQQNFVALNFESYESHGSKALFLFLQRNGYSFQHSTQLPDKADRIVLVLTNNAPRNNWADMRNWLKQGGTAIELAMGKPALTAKRTLLRRFDSNIAPAPEAPFLTGLYYQPYRQELYAISKPETALFRTDGYSPIYLEKVNTGKLITWCDPLGLGNSHLKNYPDNGLSFILLLHTLSLSREILIYSPPQLASTAWSRQFSYRLQWTIFFIATGIIVVLWKLSARFGRPRPLRLMNGRSYDEFIVSMASLFQQADARQFLLDNLWKQLYHTAVELSGVPVHTAPEEVQTSLDGVLTAGQGRFIQLYRRVTDPQTLKLSRKDFLHLLIELGHYRKELQQWKKSMIASLR